MVNCTVVNNLADGEISDSYGGGLYSEGEGESIIRNSIFANNSAESSSNGHDIYGPVQSADFNLIRTESGATVNGVKTHNITGQDPALGGLTDNGGQTWTHALQAGSPAIDAGSCEDGDGHQLDVDQRERIRPQGYGCDIGAYEAQPELTLNKAVNNSLPEPGERITYTITIDNDSTVVDAVGGTISDTLPSGVILSGSVLLEPAGAGDVDDSSDVIQVSNLVVESGEQVVLTIPVSVDASEGTKITNTATLACGDITGLRSDSQSIVVTRDTYEVFIPLAVRAQP